MKKEKLVNIIKEEVSNQLKAAIVSTMTRAREEVTKELTKRGMKVRWIKDGKKSITFAGKEEFELDGKITYGEESAVVRAAGVVNKLKGNEVSYRGEVFSSSKMLKIFKDPEEFVLYLKERARGLEFPKQLGGDFPEYR